MVTVIFWLLLSFVVVACVMGAPFADDTNIRSKK